VPQRSNSLSHSGFPPPCALQALLNRSDHHDDH
jgi:hypothetical protein